MHRVVTSCPTHQPPPGLSTSPIKLMMVVVMMVAILLLSVVPPCQGGRYRRCQDGCCIHEYCAYGLICYPRIHCHLGCPDGYCSGAGGEPNHAPFQHGNPSATKHIPEQGFRFETGAHITENYSHADKKEKQDVNGLKLKPKKRSAGSSSIPEGICMPLPPCKKSDACNRMGHSCSHNFNLGYSVCQYNLDIGTTLLCYDTHGKFVATPRH